MTPSPGVASEALVLSCDFDAILAERDGLVRFAEQVDELLRQAPQGFPRLFLDRRSSRDDWSVDVVRRDANRWAWERLMKESGLWSFLDSKGRQEWREQIEHGVPPEFNAENAEATMRGIHEKRGEMVARGVEDVFRRLSGRFKTNAPNRFRRRMILTGVNSEFGRQHACDNLDDLTRALCVLRGVPEPDHRNAAWARVGAARAAYRARKDGDTSAPVAEFDFFDVRLFRNGNGHLTFRFQADVDRLNRVLAYGARGAIPDSVRR